MKTLLVDFILLGGKHPQVVVLVDSGGDGGTGANLVLVADSVLVRKSTDVPSAVASLANFAEVVRNVSITLLDVVDTDLCTVSGCPVLKSFRWSSTREHTSRPALPCQVIAATCVLLGETSISLIWVSGSESQGSLARLIFLAV